MNFPPDQAGGGGGCVPACQSAIENQSHGRLRHSSGSSPMRSASHNSDSFAAFIRHAWGVPKSRSTRATTLQRELDQHRERRTHPEELHLTYAAAPGGQYPCYKQVAKFVFLARNAKAIVCPGCRSRPASGSTGCLRPHGTIIASRVSHDELGAPSSAYYIIAPTHCGSELREAARRLLSPRPTPPRGHELRVLRRAVRERKNISLVN